MGLLVEAAFYGNVNGDQLDEDAPPLLGMATYSTWVLDPPWFMNSEPGSADAVGILEPNRMDGPLEPNRMATTCDELCPDRAVTSWHDVTVEALTAPVTVVAPVIAAVPLTARLLEPVSVFVTVSVFANVNGCPSITPVSALKYWFTADESIGLVPACRSDSVLALI